jgi:hypothetical protein
MQACRAQSSKSCGLPPDKASSHATMPSRKKRRTALSSARRLFRPPLIELMPDSAVKTASQSDPANPSSQPDGNVPAASTLSTDAEKKLARAARSAQRLAQLTSAPRGDTTLDLFAEDIERATFQAMNTDIRQGTLAGFELPDVFLAAVPSGAASESAPARRAARASADGATPEPAEADSAQTAETRRGGRALSASASMARPSATRSAAAEPPLNDELALEMDVPAAAANEKPDVAADADTDSNADFQSAPDDACADLRRAPSSLAAALIDADRRGRTTDDAPQTNERAAPELDRATAFADTIDALYAVIADQRASSTAHSRRMKTLLTIIVCAMLVTIATGVAQTFLLMRMSRDTAVQQQRIEQLMLNQQATLSSFFDTDSANVSTSNALNTPKESADASPIQPVSAARRDAAPNRHATQHAHHRTATTAR